MQDLNYFTKCFLVIVSLDSHNNPCYAGNNYRGQSIQFMQRRKVCLQDKSHRQCPYWILRLQSWFSLSSLLTLSSLHRTASSLNNSNPEGAMTKAFLHILAFFFSEKYFCQLFIMIFYSFQHKELTHTSSLQKSEW